MRNRYTACIEERFEVRVRPTLPEPVARVRKSLASLLGDGLVVLTGSLQEGVALVGLRRWDAVFVQESLDLRLRPTIVPLAVKSCAGNYILTCQKPNP